jgi:prepilin-type N-terminal cleavage/methylation domain-containing protein
MDGIAMTIKDRSYHSSAVLIKNRAMKEINNFNDHGFSLIEAMIALTVMLVGMLGVMGMQYYAITGNTSSREMRIATTLSLEALEQSKSMQYTVLQNGTDNPFPSSDTSLTGGVSSYTRRWWVVPDCIALNTTPLSDACTADPCSAAIVASCDANGDPDNAVTVPVSALRSRTCWQDKNECFHSVTIDSIRWNENVTP